MSVFLPLCYNDRGFLPFYFINQYNVYRVDSSCLRDASGYRGTSVVTPATLQDDERNDMPVPLVEAKLHRRETDDKRNRSSSSSIIDG